MLFRYSPLAAVILVAASVGVTGTEVTSSTTGYSLTGCPSVCHCSTSKQTVDCSSRRISDVDSIVDQLDPGVSELDLRSNQITAIRSRAFARLSNLSVLWLDDNIIETVEPNAFQGLSKVRTLSLARNRLRTVLGYAFSEVVGKESACALVLHNASHPCTIDLTNNNIVSVERYAFAWIQRLQVKLGNSNVTQTIDAYAFYGARFIPRIQVKRIPSLTLRPRMFTNTEDVEVLEIADTTIERLDKFVFEGLKNVDRIRFVNVAIGHLESFAFTGIHFKTPQSTSENDINGRPKIDNRNPATNGEKRRKFRTERFAHNGGSVSFVNCQLQLIQTDSFRDTNMARIDISSSEIGLIERQAFQATVGLQSLRIIGSHFVSQRLVRESFASLRGLQQLHLLDNDFSVIEPFAFRDVVDTHSFRIRFRSSDVTLMTEAFSHVSDIEQLSLSSDLQATLQIDVGSFRNLVSVDQLIVENFNLPIIGRHTFAGLSRIANLTIANCQVTTVERESFGDATSHVGAIEHLDIGKGNQLQCNCPTGSLQREFELRFNDYVAYCYFDGNAENLVDVHELGSLACSDALRTIASPFVVLVGVVVRWLAMSLFRNR
jgi:Leucine-rich repeat (LRR) protein